jgi:hypothetical protein
VLLRRRPFFPRARPAPLTRCARGPADWRSADFFYAGFVVSLVVGSATMPLAVAAALVSRRPSLVALRVVRAAADGC